ncbi:MAG: hypothetical protein IT379_09980, partial [Deltaproteobacteria bacterium]|nr:hypothetical protein [Deltaproteobacteria bacterium]
MHPRPPSKVLKVHPEQLPPQVRQAIEALRASPVEPPCFLVSQGWRGGVDSIGFARHLVKVGDLDGDLVILTADTVGDVCIVQVLRTCVILKLYAKQEKIWVDFRYEDRETCKAAWPRWKAARVQYFDALAAGDEARARSLDPLHDWASAGYPVGPVPEHVEKARAA